MAVRIRACSARRCSGKRRSYATSCISAWAKLYSVSPTAVRSCRNSPVCSRVSQPLTTCGGWSTSAATNENGMSRPIAESVSSSSRSGSRSRPIRQTTSSSILAAPTAPPAPTAGPPQKRRFPLGAREHGSHQPIGAIALPEHGGQGGSTIGGGGGGERHLRRVRLVDPGRPIPRTVGGDEQDARARHGLYERREEFLGRAVDPVKILDGEDNWHLFARPHAEPS